MVVLQEELGQPFVIGSITYVFCWGEEFSFVNDFQLSMAHVEIDQLSSVFAENYEPGTLQQVFFCDSLFLCNGYGNQLTIELDNPFYYNGTDNLLIDIYYPTGYCYSQVYNWEAGMNRALLDFIFGSGSGGPTGELFEYLPFMVIEEYEDLSQNTFGGIKVILGGEQ